MVGELIQKEEISKYTFSHALIEKAEYWHKELAYHVRLGNEFKGKTLIVFQTKEGVKSVETTIWSIAEKFLQLKGGVNIPLYSIIDVHF